MYNCLKNTKLIKIHRLKYINFSRRLVDEKIKSHLIFHKNLTGHGVGGRLTQHVHLEELDGLLEKGESSRRFVISPLQYYIQEEEEENEVTGQ